VTAARVGEQYHRIETEDVIESVLGHPQIAKPEGVGALGDVAHHRDVDRVRRPMRQRNTERNCVLQDHA
jgi:hypothetical protein